MTTWEFVQRESKPSRSAVRATSSTEARLGLHVVGSITPIRTAAKSRCEPPPRIPAKVDASGRRRLRTLGMRVGDMPTGPRNAISDVAGVRVGHVTLIADPAPGVAVRTGVTAVVPPGDVFTEKVPAASF